MSVDDDAVSADLVRGPLAPLSVPQLLLLAGAVVGCALLFALTVGHGQVASGDPDPAVLPPPTSAAGQMLEHLAGATAPLAGFLGLLVSGVDVAGGLRQGRTRRQVALAAAVAVLSAVVLVGCAVLSPPDARWLD